MQHEYNIKKFNNKDMGLVRGCMYCEGVCTKECISKEEPRNAVFGYKTSIVGQMLDSDGGFGQVEQSIDENALESEHFHKADTIDGQWLSLVKSEREWQEEKLAEIFHHYPNACPRWQYMNGLIHMALEYIEMTKEKE